MTSDETIANGNVDNLVVAHERKAKKRTLSKWIKDFGPVINLLASIINAVSRLA